MNKLWQKVSSDAVYIKKEVIYLILSAIAIIVIIILAGFYYVDTKTQQPTNNTKTDTVKKVADSADTQWYRQQAELQAASALKNGQKSTTSTGTNINNTTQILETQSTNTVNTGSLTNTNNGDLQKAMSAAINTNQITNDQINNTQPGGGSLPPNNPGISGNAAPQNDDQNMQGEKKAFLQVNGQPNPDDYLSSTIQNPVSQFELQAGTIIPGVLITGINSDLPGQITGKVRSNVYDSISGANLLIPQGAKLVGLYDSQVTYGQERVLIAWKRIIFPNGQSIDLQGMPGADLSGYAGFNDQVDNHYVKIFGSVILMSLLSAGAQLSQPQNQTSVFVNSTPTVGQTLAQSLGTNIANTGTMITQKNINIQPTLMIRPGYEFNINVTKDMVFPGSYQG